MALIDCRECGAAISDQATACPHCGAPTGAKPRKTVSSQEIMQGVVGLIALGAILYFFGGTIRDFALSWLGATAPAPAFSALPTSTDDFATIVSNTGCQSRLSDDKKADLFSNLYKDHAMTFSGEILTLDSGRAGLKLLPASLTPGQRRHRCPTRRTQLHRHRLPPPRVEACQRPAGKARELIERLPHKARVAAKGCHDVGLDRRIIRAGHIEFQTGRDDLRRDDAQILALSWSEGVVGRHNSPQSNRLARRCFI
jgi:hypothetical protein